MDHNATLAGYGNNFSNIDSRLQPIKFTRSIFEKCRMNGYVGRFENRKLFYGNRLSVRYLNESRHVSQVHCSRHNTW